MELRRTIAAITALALMVGLFVVCARRDKKPPEQPRWTMAEPSHNEPTMITVDEPPDWAWEDGDETPLDEECHADVLFSEPRSACWKKARAEYLVDHPRCEFKGCTETDHLNVHHVVPFAVDSSKECMQSNLISACRYHHIWCAHLGNFREHNRRVRADFAAGRYPIIGWERLLANREKHKRMRERKKAAIWDVIHWSAAL